VRSFLDPDLIARTYRDPLALLVLLVDLLPVIAVLAFGWGATPLVALYWLENLVIGVFTIFRMVATLAGNVANLFTVLFIVPFFTFHYGMFCFGHGVFIRALATSGSSHGTPDMPGLVGWALQSGQGMLWFVGAIIVINLAIYVSDFLLKGEFRHAQPMVEMFAPYGRIVTLHVAIILGAVFAISTNEPLLGVVFLIFLRVVFGVVVSAMRQRKLDRTSDATAKDFPSTA
jgi:Family of unknown function (DUF6498)